MRGRVLASMGLLVAAFSLVLLTDPVSAATNNKTNSGDAMRISPVRTDITVNPGSKKTVDVTVTNVTSSVVTLNAIVNDFGASGDESGKPKIFLDANTSAPSHGLKNYVLPISSVTLNPGQQATVKVTIDMPENIAAGGYFGAVRFVPSGSDSAGKSVTLSGSVGSLLLVTVPGDSKEQMGISSFTISRNGGKASNFFTNSSNLQATVRFKNSGDVQEKPFGKLIIQKSGSTISNIEINTTEPKSVVLPDSIRRFDITIPDKKLGLGKYTATGNFGYGDNGQLLSASTTFYVVPMPLLVVAIFVIIVLLSSIAVLPRMLKSHDRKLLRKMRKGKN